jgi:hypothetical protein
MKKAKARAGEAVTGDILQPGNANAPTVIIQISKLKYRLILT